MRFLTLCPECDEPIAQKDMEDHQREAHKQNKECQKRAMKCNICDLEIPFKELQKHLDTCGSRTEKCQECNKYIMYKDQPKHKDICPNSNLAYQKDVDFQTSEASTNTRVTHRTEGTGGNLYEKCSKSFPDDQHSQHLNECKAAHKLTKVLAGESTSNVISDPVWSSSSLAPSFSSENAMVWRDVRPKWKERDQPLTSKTPKNKKIGFPSPTRGGCSTSPQALKDTESFDVLVTCDYCNILLPLPTLRKHEVVQVGIYAGEETAEVPGSKLIPGWQVCHWCSDLLPSGYTPVTLHLVNAAKTSCHCVQETFGKWRIKSAAGG
ncbi:XIAP associated factor 1 [Willisornis vidua]|uniref:XIAP associated factor 1 n=1 Tax=Willisornis vidua TaxID=1566151 RepID=A0ABQ9DGI9_9PASS|nr:XIAP associated factor 1 [Willisornis vidua]